MLKNALCKTSRFNTSKKGEKMSKTYERVMLGNVEKSRIDVMQRQRNHNYKCNLAAIGCQIQVACDFLNIALERLAEIKR